MEKKQTKNIDISVQEPEEIFHPDYVASQQKKKKRYFNYFIICYNIYFVCNILF